MGISSSDRFVGAENVKPSNVQDLTRECSGIYIGSVPEEKKGQIIVQMANGRVVKYSGLSSGDELSVHATRIFETGTTASDIVVLYTELRLRNYNQASDYGFPVSDGSPNPNDDHFYEYGTLDSATCPAIPDSYIISSHPRTMFNGSGELVYQPHNFLKEFDVPIILLHAHPYKLWWKGERSKKYGFFQLEMLNGTISETHDIVTDEWGVGYYDFVATDKIQRITVCWEEPAFFPEDWDVNIGLVTTYFPTFKGDWPRFGVKMVPRENNMYDKPRGNCFQYGLLIETQSSMNIFPRSEPGIKWSGSLKSTLYKFSSDLITNDPAGSAGAWVLHHNRVNSDPRDAFSSDRLRCPYPVGITAGDPLTFSVFVLPITYNEVVIRIANKISVKFNFEDYESSVTKDEKEKDDISISVSTTTMVDYASGWVRISVGMESTESIPKVQIEIIPLEKDVIDASGKSGPLGLDIPYFAIWGVQIERNILPSSFLPTFGTPLQLPGEYLEAKHQSYGDLAGKGKSLMLFFSLPPYLKNLRVYGEAHAPHHLVWWFGGTGNQDFGFLFYIEYELGVPSLCVVHIDDSYFHYGGHTRDTSQPPDIYVMRKIPLDKNGFEFTIVFSTLNREMIAFVNGQKGEILSNEGIDKKYIHSDEAEFCGQKAIELWNPDKVKPPDGFYNTKYRFKYGVPIGYMATLDKHLEIQEVLDVFH